MIVVMNNQTITTILAIKNHMIIFVTLLILSWV